MIKPVTLSLSSGKIFVETVKAPFKTLNEAHKESIIVRMFEGYGGRGSVQIVSGTIKKIAEVSIINALENQVFESIVQDKFTIKFGPFQIITVKIDFQ